MIEQQTIKRPTGMTILLVLSLINACLQIFSSLGMFLTIPFMNEMMANGQMEETMRPFFTLFSMDQDTINETMNVMTTRLTINRMFYLITAVLYIGSLVGVIKMFKLQRIGFHVYSISQMLILITAAAFVYSKPGLNTFFNDFLMTIMFILIYHLYFKRMEFQKQFINPNDHDGQAEGE